MIALHQTRIELTPDELARLRTATERDAHAFVDRLSGRLDVERIEQPWFRRFRILEIDSPVPFPARRLHVAVSDTELLVLTGRLQHLQQVAADDPPSGLDGKNDAE